jgi:hypothetical protein
MSSKERELYEYCTSAISDFKGERAIQNEHYANRTRAVLDDTGEDFGAIVYGRVQSILTELGRIRDDARLLEVAREVFTQLDSMRVREAVAYVRARRLGPPKPNRETLERAISQCVYEWMARYDHSSDTAVDALDALDSVRRDIRRELLTALERR